MPFDFRPEQGEISDGATRYILMRPDVLMGVAQQLAASGGDFFAALEASAFVHAQASFAAYLEEARFGAGDFLLSSSEVAANLGWGSWSIDLATDGARVVTVVNSPFADGHGPATRPTCAPIAGVLRAIALVGYGEDVEVEETSCVAQGAAQCCFRIAEGPGKPRA